MLTVAATRSKERKRKMKEFTYAIQVKFNVTGNTPTEADANASEAIRIIKEAALEKGISLDYSKPVTCTELP